MSIKDPKNQEKLNFFISQFAPIINRAANSLVKTGKVPKHMDVDELKTAGVVGLMRAVKNFDPTKGAKLSTFAQKYMTGEMQQRIKDTGPIHDRIIQRARNLHKQAKLEEQKIKQPETPTIEPKVKTTPEAKTPIVPPKTEGEE